jgi:hypothetical protein
MEIKSKLIELIDRMSREEQALFNKLSEAERSTLGKSDRWSPKDVIIHIAGWKMRLVENLIAVGRGETPLRYENYESVNAKYFEENRERPWSEVLEQAKEASRQLVEQVELRSEDELQSAETLPWQEGRPLWRLIVGNGCIHPLSMHLCPLYIERGDKAYASALQEEIGKLLQELDEGGNWQGLLRYNLACHHALMGETKYAIDVLEEALRLNPDLIAWSKEDPDLASIRKEAGYQKLYIKKASEKSNRETDNFEKNL